MVFGNVEEDITGKLDEAGLVRSRGGRYFGGDHSGK